MATSSIFADVSIEDPKMAEIFTDAYIESIEHPIERHYIAKCSMLTDPEEIKSLLSKGKDKK